MQTNDPLRIIVLGAGISGLATTWYLTKAYPSAEIIVLEASNRAGGLLHTDHTAGFHFEKGPRTFRISQCSALLQLALDLGLKEQILCSAPPSSHRYLWFAGALKRLPHHLLSFLGSPLTKGCIPAFLSEWKRPVVHGDETVWDFVSRRFNRDVAMRLFDPLVVGIFGGDARKISVRACFPTLKLWEEKYGSVTKGFFKELRRSVKEIQGFPAQAIFSLRGGMEELVRALLTKTPAQYLWHREAVSVECKERKVYVRTKEETFRGDALFCALPMGEAARLFSQNLASFEIMYQQTPQTSMAIVNVGYNDALLSVNGFGYLIPTYAKEEILGVIFDSQMIPEHNKRAKETRLTVYIEDKGGEDDFYREAALRGLKRHLGIVRTPTAISLKRVRDAFPQYEVGHLEKMAALLQKFPTVYPRCFLVGNYLNGIGVNACILRAEQSVKTSQTML